MAAGRRQAEIAPALGLSERTVENHLRNARRRLGVTTTAGFHRQCLFKDMLDVIDHGTDARSTEGGKPRGRSTVARP
nr:LuxR C-terminal-related transcriptional regulator [Paraburkholderia sacchari]